MLFVPNIVLIQVHRDPTVDPPWSLASVRDHALSTPAAVTIRDALLRARSVFPFVYTRPSKRGCKRRNLAEQTSEGGKLVVRGPYEVSI